MKNTVILPFLSMVLIQCANSENPRSETEAYANPLDSINSLIKQDPGSSDLYFARAKEYYSQKDLPSSLSDVGRALKLDSSNAEYYIFLANLKILNKQSRESRDALLKAYKIDPTNTDVLVKLGELYMLVDDFKTSFRYLNEALKIDIHLAEAYRLKGFNYKYAGDTAKAVSSFQTAVEQDPSDYDSYLQLGLLFSIPLEPIALEYYDNALRIRPTSLEALYAKALHLQRAGQPRKALALYSKISDLNPNYFNAYYNRGYIYLEMLSVYDSTEVAFNQAIEFGPDNYFQAIYNRGLSRERAGNIEGAIKDYRAVLKISPQYDPAALGLSRLGK
ncbi:MAG: hypothetical protein Salg2KO_16620 [Salibacteraceae bacterium]